jgi:DNA polymerase
MGVDEVVGEVPVDRFAARKAPAPTPIVAAEPVAMPPADPNPVAYVRPMASAEPVLATDETARQAREVAAACTNLDELRGALERFEGCNLRLTARSLVFADGRPGSRVMLVGEAPGREEDLQGLPFVGRSGQLLDLMLRAIGLGRADVYIANVVPWRPPGNRTPTPQETAVCRPFIQRQIELSAPDFLICLGGAAAKELMQTNEGILRLRGQWRTFALGERTIRAMATLHPAYLLRQPLQKRLAWRDFLAISEALATTGSTNQEGSSQ